MYDDLHRFYIMSADPEKQTQLGQKGLYEPLLCQPCDNRLSKHEKYVREFLYGGTGLYAEQKGNKFSFTGLDYTAVRLCYLSILWRMSISSLPIFNKVSLGPHEDRLRELIRNNDPGAADQYGFVAVILFMKGKPISDFILQPEYVRHKGHRIYRMVIGGLLFMFNVSSHNVSPEVARAFIQPNGSWQMLGEDVSRIPYLYEWFKEASLAEKARMNRT